MVSPEAPSSDGAKPGASSGSMEDDAVCTTSPTSTPSSSTRRKRQRQAIASPSSMDESLPLTSQATSNDRSVTCKKRARTSPLLSKTSAVDSTFTAGALQPFWNVSIGERSKKLWLPTKTDCVATDSNSVSGSFRRLGQNSWFSATTFHRDRSKNSPTTYYPSSPSSLPGAMASDRPPIGSAAPPLPKTRKKIQKLKNENQEAKKPKKPAPGRCRSIRIYPTPDQTSLLKKWMGAVRWTYNECVRLVCREKTAKNNLKELRAAVVNLDSPAVSANEWLKDVPYDVRDEGVRDFIKAVEINKMKGERFEMKFRSKKDPSDTIVVHSKYWRNDGLSFRNWGGSKLRSAEPLPPSLEYDSRIQRMRTGEFFMRMPMAGVVRGEN